MGTGINTRRIIGKLLPVLLPFTLFFLIGITVTFLQSLGFLLPGVDTVLPFGAYRELFTSSWFFPSFAFSLKVAFASSLTAVAAGTLLGYTVWRLPAGTRRAASGYAVPLVLPHIAVAFLVLLLWSQTGIISSFLGKIGLIDEYTQFPDFIYRWNGAAIVFAYVYKEIPFVMLMVLSVLENFDRNQIITAKMLGGKEVRIFVKVVLPFLLPIIHTLFVILFVYSFGAFDIPFILGKSSPSMMSVKIFRLYFMRDISARPESLAALAFVLIFSVLSIYLYFRIMRLIGLKDRGIL